MSPSLRCLSGSCHGEEEANKYTDGVSSVDLWNKAVARFLLNFVCPVKIDFHAPSRKEAAMSWVFICGDRKGKQ